jgi:hypothetical protein
VHSSRPRSTAASSQFANVSRLSTRGSQGYILSHHVLQVNNAHAGEPDLILALESKDYRSNARQLDIQKKFEAFAAMNGRKIDRRIGRAQGDAQVRRRHGAAGAEAQVIAPRKGAAGAAPTMANARAPGPPRFRSRRAHGAFAVPRVRGAQR